MIRLIAAMDDKHGLAGKHGLPWQGKVPMDVTHFHKLIEGQAILMGQRTYQEFTKPLADVRNFVLTASDEPLRPGFEPVKDLTAFLQNPPQDLWILGGANVFAQTLDFAEELHLTHIEGDFHCTKFFPPFEHKFTLAEESQAQTQNGITFKFTTYIKKPIIQSEKDDVA